MQIHSDYSLLRHNTFGIDVKCRQFVEYNDENELRETLKMLKENTEAPWLHIGGGSNLLFTKDYPGTILHSGIYGKEIIEESDESVLLRVGAAEDWDKLVEWCVEKGLHGLENLSLIPGEAGASAVQNIGAYGVEVESLIEKVETLKVETGEARIFLHDECEYGYRTSVFKQHHKGKFIVTHVQYRLSKQFLPQISYGALKNLSKNPDMPPTAAEVRNEVIRIRREKLPDPAEIGSAGSFFMNPVVSESQFQALQSQNPDIPHYPAKGGIKVPAGWLIEQCGWKGKQLGQAGVHPRQALVLINLGHATGAEIAQLSRKIQEDVAERFNITLHPEVHFL